jgi:hypothetical protein
MQFPRPDSSVVERGPEKAGVGGSIPSLATILESITYSRKSRIATVLQVPMSIIGRCLNFGNRASQRRP